MDTHPIIRQNLTSLTWKMKNDPTRNKKIFKNLSRKKIFKKNFKILCERIKILRFLSFATKFFTNLPENFKIFFKKCRNTHQLVWHQTVFLKNFQNTHQLVWRQTSFSPTQKHPTHPGRCMKLIWRPPPLVLDSITRHAQLKKICEWTGPGKNSHFSKLELQH